MKNQNPNFNDQANETLESLSGIRRQPVHSSLLEKLNAIPSSKLKIMRLDPRLAWRVAACLAIMIILNVVTILNRQNKISHNSRSPFASEYFSYLKTPSI
jgi:hypothetical protein